LTDAEYEGDDPLDLDEIIQTSVLMVDIYYSSLAYTKMSESQAISIDQMIASIGGNMGLLVGMSVLTICEFFQLIATIVFTLLTAKFKKSEIKPQL
jgi:hypothetical protein